MKKCNFIIGAFLLCLATGVGSISAQNYSGSANSSSNSIQTTEYQKSKGENKLLIQYPVSGGEKVVAAIQKWIDRTLGDTYKGDLGNGQALFDYYWPTIIFDYDPQDYDVYEAPYRVEKFLLDYQNSLIVTYLESFYEYGGGAHGMGGEIGVTFLKSNGSTFGYDCFKSAGQLQPLIVAGLKAELGCKTDRQLLNALMDYKRVSEIPIPEWEPWITDKGVVFRYSSYEIGPYSLGQPTVTIPYSKLAPYLTEKGKSFFK